MVENFASLSNGLRKHTHKRTENHDSNQLQRGDNAAGRFADLYAQEVDFDMDAQTFKEFTKKVGETFLPKEIRQEAERKLMALKQGPKDLVSDFFVRLKQLTLEAGYDTRVQG